MLLMKLPDAAKNKPAKMTVETLNASIFSFFVKGRELTTYLSLEVEELTH